MAHMDRMVIKPLWGMREERILNRSPEKYLEYAPREPIDAMRQKGVKVTFHARKWPGSGCLSTVKLSRHHLVVVRSTIHRADPLTWSRTTIFVTPGAFLSRLVRQIRERIWWSARV
jgi:hypothetical protein